MSRTRQVFFPSPFDEAAILTVDGVGEWATAVYGTGKGNPSHLTHQLHFPHSLGHALLGLHLLLRVQGSTSGEYKLMGLAPYGGAEACRLDPREADRPEAGRVVPHGHVVLQLLPGPDDDFEEI